MTNLTIGDITGVDKKGWEYLWVRYTDSVNDTAKALVKKPIAAYVERVYEYGDFGLLGISAMTATVVSTRRASFCYDVAMRLETLTVSRPGACGEAYRRKRLRATDDATAPRDGCEGVSRWESRT